MASENYTQLKKKYEQTQKALEDAKITIGQLEINIEILSRNAEQERNNVSSSMVGLDVLRRENAELYADRRTLKLENKKLKEDNEILEQRVSDLKHSLEEANKNTEELGKTMEKSSDYYIKQIKQLQAENAKLRKNQTSEPIHNERGAGRKKNDETYMKRYHEFADLVRVGKSMAEVMEQMQISRSTYFRFMKSYKENLEFDTVIATAQEENRKKNKV